MITSGFNRWNFLRLMKPTSGFIPIDDFLHFLTVFDISTFVVNLTIKKGNPPTGRFPFDWRKNREVILRRDSLFLSYFLQYVFHFNFLLFQIFLINTDSEQKRTKQMHKNILYFTTFIRNSVFIKIVFNQITD